MAVRDVIAVVLYAILTLVDSGINQDQIQADSFDVKPGAGRQEFVQQLDEVKCIFSYKAQGGTKEQWLMTVARDAAHSEWVCTAERPAGLSYLFFEEFRLQLTGAELQSVTLEASLNKEPGVLLQDSEYNIVKHLNAVEQNLAQFKSQLTRVQILATRSAHSSEL